KRCSIYGAQRLQTVAIGGKRNRRRKGTDGQKKPLPSVGTRCLRRWEGGGRQFESVRGLSQNSRKCGLLSSSGPTRRTAWVRQGYMSLAKPARIPSLSWLFLSSGRQRYRLTVHYM